MKMEELKEPKQQETTNNQSIECYFYSKPLISLAHVLIRAQYHIYYQQSNEQILGPHSCQPPIFVSKQAV